jgi:hypothetical protein
MTGSIQAQFIVPIVAVIVLAVWLTLVYLADAHPRWKHSRALGPESTRSAAEAAALSGHDEDEQAPSPPVHRRAA